MHFHKSVWAHHLCWSSSSISVSSPWQSEGCKQGGIHFLIVDFILFIYLLLLSRPTATWEVHPDVLIEVTDTFTGGKATSTFKFLLAQRPLVSVAAFPWQFYTKKAIFLKFQQSTILICRRLQWMVWSAQTVILIETCPTRVDITHTSHDPIRDMHWRDNMKKLFPGYYSDLPLFKSVWKKHPMRL